MRSCSPWSSKITNNAYIRALLVGPKILEYDQHWALIPKNNVDIGLLKCVMWDGAGFMLKGRRLLMQMGIGVSCLELGV